MDQTNAAERNYIAFISYRHLPLDREAAVRIQKKIENYVVPKDLQEKTGGKKLGVCFRDEDELPASSSLSDSITYALDHTEYLIVICTPDLPQSKWCLQEVSYFLRTHDRDHVLAVLADGTPEESFPEQLRFTYDDEGRQLAEVEPLAANIAGEGHKINNKTFKKEVTRLIAAMLGCPFDNLWQRERRARTNRLMAAMGVGVAAMAVVMGIVLSKNAQISRQNTQIVEQNGQIREQMDQIQEQNDQIMEQMGQISEQKEQIEEQNTELQRQVSSVLVNSGRMQLESFDRAAALDSALKALESNDPAIYDHDAELLLTDALGAYGYQQPQYSVIYEQNTDISNLAVSEDGLTIFTGDASGVVRAMSAEDSSLLWEQPLNSNDVPMITPLRSNELVLCKTRTSLFALSMEDGSVVWSKDYSYYCRFYALSPDQSVVAVLAKETYEALELFFFDTASGKDVCRADLSLDDHDLMDRGLYSYEYGGAFSADGTRFACMIPCYTQKEDDELQEYSGFFLTDLRDGSVTPLASFDGRSDTLLAMHVKEDDTLYCAFTTSHKLYSAIIPLDPAAESTSNIYDYSRSSAVGISGSVTEGEAGWVQSLFSKDLALLFSRNKIYVMELSDGTLRFTFDLETAVAEAQWIDPEEEIFQVITEGGMTVSYDLCHDGEQVFKTAMGKYTALSQVQAAGFIHDGFFYDPQDGRTLMVSKNFPTRLIAIETVTDPSFQVFAENEIWQQSWSAVTSPSGKRLLVSASGTDPRTLVFDIESGELAGEFAAPFDGVFSGLMMPDDDHFVYQGVQYGLDGSVKTLSPQLSNVSPETTLLYDGTLLFTREIYLDDAAWTGGLVRVLSYQLGGDLAHQHSGLKDGICMQFDSSFPGSSYLFAAGKNGWLAGYGLYTYADEGQAPKTTEKPVLVAQNAATGEKTVLDFFYDGQPVTRLAFSDHSPLLAAETADGQVLLYDLEKGTGRVLTDLYAYGEIDSLCFSDQDDLLLLYTSTGRLDGYDLKTGDMIFSVERPFSSTGVITGLRWLSAVRLSDHRLLVEGGQYAEHGWAAILDTESWTLAARIDNFYGYSADSGLILQKTGHTMSSCPIHDLEELKERASDLIYWRLQP